MALEGKFEAKSGITATEAYAKVSNLVVDYYGKSGSVTVKVFYDATARGSGKIPLDTKTYFFNVETTIDSTGKEVIDDKFTPIFDPASNILVNVYDFLKAGDFKGWKDA